MMRQVGLTQCIWGLAAVCFVALLATGAWQGTGGQLAAPKDPAKNYPLVQDVSAEAAALIAQSNEEKKPVLLLASVKDLTELPRELLDMPHVAYLSIEGSGVSDVSLLALMPQLRGIRLGNTKVTDLSPLAGLSELKVLELQNTQVSDLSVLSGLSKLKKVTASGSQISDLTPLSQLQRLENLDVDGTNVTDLSPLAGASALKKLSFRDTGVTDISVLSGLPSLVLVQAQNSAVTDFRPALTWPAMQPFVDRKGSRAGGLWFAYSQAAMHDVKLDEIASGAPRLVLKRLAAYYRTDWPIKTENATN